jgi:hypothetical protein
MKRPARRASRTKLRHGSIDQVADNPPHTTSAARMMPGSGPA